jgi:hypothetical protein
MQLCEGKVWPVFPCPRSLCTQMVIPPSLFQSLRDFPSQEVEGIAHPMGLTLYDHSVGTNALFSLHL